MADEIFVRQIITADDFSLEYFSSDQLSGKICDTDAINGFYIDLARRGVKWVCQRCNAKTDAADLPGEKWQPCRSVQYAGIWASNFGRIKVRGRLVQLCDTVYKNKRKLLQPVVDMDTPGAGWLELMSRPGVYVYRLVADAWLVRPERGRWAVHHISNDGYDNRPENLIYLPRPHNAIHTNARPRSRYSLRFYDKLS